MRAVRNGCGFLDIQTLCCISTAPRDFQTVEFAWKIESNRGIMPVRILIADDSRTVRRSLHRLLEGHGDWIVCADAVDGADAIAKAQQCKPDVVVMDFFMPGMTGIEAGQALGRLLPSVPVLIVTLYITAQLVADAKSAGIKGAAPKSDTGQIINGVEALMHQNTFFKENYPSEAF